MNEKPNFSNPEHYKEIFTEEQRAEHLPLDRAHDTANMMRASLGIDPIETGKINSKKYDKDKKLSELLTHNDLIEWRKINTDVTKEDYEFALKKIEEIEKLADEETSEEEFDYKLKKIVQVGGQVLATTILVPLGILSAHYKDMKNGLETFKKNREKLIDAKTILKKFIKEGDKFGEKEKEYNWQETI